MTGPDIVATRPGGGDPAPGSLASPARPPGRRLAGWLPWVAVAVAVAVALAVGTHRSPGSGSIESRTLSIASQVRCPVCVGETAAESQTAASVEIRSIIRQRLAEGQSTATILAYFRQIPGPSMLEKPSSHGAGLLLWGGPVIAVVIAAGGLALVFRRWRPTARRAATDGDQRLVGRALGQPGDGAPPEGTRPAEPAGGRTDG